LILDVGVMEGCAIPGGSSVSIIATKVDSGCRGR
jgi:hypothetical protein